MSYHSSSSELSGLDEYQRLLSLLDSRQFEEAQVRARVLLECDELSPLVRAKTHNLLCWTFIEGLKVPSPEAVLHGEEAVSLAKALEEPSLHIQVLCNLATAYYQVADYKAAKTAYQEILNMLEGRNELLPYGAPIARKGLAQIALVQGRTREAMTQLNAAEALCADDELKCLLPDMYRRRALLHLRLGQPEDAAADLDRIDEEAVAAGPRSLWWKTHLGFTRARVEMALGNAGCRKLVVNTLALARELGDLPVIAECTCLLALLDHAAGRRDAVKRARAALSHAIRSGRRDVLDEVRGRLRPILIHEH